MDSSGSEFRLLTSPFEEGKEVSGSIKYWKFRHNLSHC
jgi:hypothetical protein